MIIAVDFDGTCVTHEYPKVGEAIGATKVLRALVAKGHRLLLLTMRDGEDLVAAENWFKAQHIPLWASNHNPEQDAWSKSRKVFAHLYIDDVALGIPIINNVTQARPFVDWERVEQLLLKEGIL